jgi:hypothetical protein
MAARLASGSRRYVQDWLEINIQANASNAVALESNKDRILYWDIERYIDPALADAIIAARVSIPPRSKRIRGPRQIPLAALVDLKRQDRCT